MTTANGPRENPAGSLIQDPTLRHEEIVDNYTQVVDDMYLAEEQGRRELFGWIIDAMGGYVVPGRRLLVRRPQLRHSRPDASAVERWGAADASGGVDVVECRARHQPSPGCRFDGAASGAASSHACAAANMSQFRPDC